MHNTEIFPLATAIRECLLRGYSLKLFSQDFLAGLVVSLIALPLAMALSIAVGLPPEHGIYTAIIAGILTALLGGSQVQVSGPTAAFVVIVAPIVAQYGLHGLMWAQILAGFILLILGFARFGRYIHYVPYPVTTGFTAGIAVVIATLSLNDFLGLGLTNLNGDFLSKSSILIYNLKLIKPEDALVGSFALLSMIITSRLSPKIPAAMVGMLVGLGTSLWLEQHGHPVATIGSRFSFEHAGIMLHGLPPYAPQFYTPTLNPGHLFTLPFFAEWKTLLMPSLVIALLAALESLLSATVADNMIGNRHNPNSELNAIGLANIASGFVAGIPATGAIARTTTNINAGARTPVAAIIHALLILFYVLAFTPFINKIPMSSLSALLLVTAYRMSHFPEIIRTFKHHRGSDLTVLIVCFMLTVFVDMVAGVIVGFLVAALLFMKRIANMTEIELYTGNIPFQEDQKAVALPDHAMLFRINGPLFFGTVEKAYEQYQFIHSHIKTVIIDIEHVPLIDMTGVISLKAMLQKLIKDECKILVCGDATVSKRILSKMEAPTLESKIIHLESVEDAIKIV